MSDIDEFHLDAHHRSLDWMTAGISLMRELEEEGGLTPAILVGFYEAVSTNAGMAVAVLRDAE